MISSKAKKAFLNRKLQSFDWMKKFSKKTIDLELKALAPRPKVRFGDIELWLHQKVSFLIMVHLKRFLIFLDMGNGKSLLTLALINYRKKRGENPKAIVFVPYITAVETWIEESEKYTPNLTCVPLLGTSVENMNTIRTVDGDLFVICYQSAVAMVSKKTKATKKTKGSWNFKAEDIRKYFKSFDMMVADEIHKIKSVSSLTYRMCKAISQRTDWVFGLTGTPFGKDLTDLWAQFYVVDQGETLGHTLGLYKDCFFKEGRNHWGGYVFTFKENLFPKLKKMIKNSSIRYSVDECHDMPQLKRIPKVLNLTESMEGYFEKANEKLKAEIKKKKRNYRTVKSIFIQLRQLSSGFMTFKGEESNDKVEIKFDSNPKLEALMELIDGMPYDSKMVVFHDFVFTNFLISAELKKNKIDHARVWGGQKDKIGQIRKFKNDKKCKVLVINSKSGSSSQNLQMANYIVFFEEPSSAIDREQAERRCWRPGQKKRVFIYDLIMKDTYDFRMRSSNRKGNDLLKDLLDGKVKVK